MTPNQFTLLELCNSVISALLLYRAIMHNNASEVMFILNHRSFTITFNTFMIIKDLYNAGDEVIINELNIMLHKINNVCDIYRIIEKQKKTALSVSGIKYEKRNVSEIILNINQ